MILFIILAIVLYIVISSMFFRSIRSRVNRKMYWVLVLTVLFLPIFDSLFSEVLFISSKLFYPMKEIYMTSKSSSYGAVGPLCAIGRHGEFDGLWIDGMGYDIVCKTYSSLKNDDLSSVEDVCSSVKLLFKDDVVYIVVSKNSRVMNVIYREKLVLDSSSCSVMAKYRDVVLLRCIPFFAFMYGDEAGSAAYIDQHEYCNFQNEVLLK